MTNPRDDLMALATNHTEVLWRKAQEARMTRNNGLAEQYADEARQWKDAIRLAASRPATQVVDSEAVAQAVTSELEKMHEDGVPMCMREGEATWRTYFAGFDLSMFAIRISDAILSILRPAGPVDAIRPDTVAQRTWFDGENIRTENLPADDIYQKPPPERGDK